MALLPGVPAPHGRLCEVEEGLLTTVDRDIRRTEQSSGQRATEQIRR